jgi:hypothetical protein
MIPAVAGYSLPGGAGADGTKELVALADGFGITETAR